MKVTCRHLSMLLILISTVLTPLIGAEATFVQQPHDTYLSLIHGGPLPTVQVRTANALGSYSMRIERDGLDVTESFILSGQSLILDPQSQDSKTVGFTFEKETFTLSDEGNYIYRFYDQGKPVAESTPFRISVLEPILLQFPTDTTVFYDDVITFNAAATGRPPLEFIWNFEGTRLTDGGYISGSSTSNLTITYVAKRHRGNYQLLVTNGYGTASAAPFKLSLLFTYGRWKNLFFAADQATNSAVSGLEVDPDIDGYSNLLEYALDLDPRVLDGPNIVQFKLERSRIGAEKVSLSFPIVKSAIDLTYRVIRSTDLLNWETHYIVQPSDFSEEDVVLKIIDVPVERGNIFLRLEVLITGQN